MIKSDLISGSQICQVLYEQGILTEEDGDRTALSNGLQLLHNVSDKRIVNFRGV